MIIDEVTTSLSLEKNLLCKKTNDLITSMGSHHSPHIPRVCRNLQWDLPMPFPIVDFNIVKTHSFEFWAMKPFTKSIFMKFLGQKNLLQISLDSQEFHCKSEWSIKVVKLASLTTTITYTTPTQQVSTIFPYIFQIPVLFTVTPLILTPSKSISNHAKKQTPWTQKWKVVWCPERLWNILVLYLSWGSENYAKKSEPFVWLHYLNFFVVI